MPDTAHWLAFLAAAFALAAVPGPGMLYVLARSLGSGTRAGVRSSLGTAAGGMAHVVAAAVGLSALLMTSAAAFDVVRLAGAAYLVLLGFRTLRSRARIPDVGRPAGDRGERALRQGALTELLNPKTALFFLTFLPQFVQPHRGPVAVQLLVLGTVSVALNSTADLVVAALAGRLGGLLRARPRWWRRQRTASGLVLLGLGGYAALGGEHRSG